jgi:hypothetical protein
MKNITPIYNLISMREKVVIPENEGFASSIGGLGTRLASTVSNAINADGDLVTEIINSKLDTDAQTILGEFTFGASGALAIATDANNGLWISPTGILAKKLGVNTLTVTDEGDVTMVGEITASTGSIGGWTISSNAVYLDGATDALSSGMASADYPFYAGKKYIDRATAPFRVTPEGALTASSATITGALTTGAGSTINGTYIDSLNANKINVGTLTGFTIQTSSSSNTGVKLSSALGGITCFGESSLNFVTTAGLAGGQMGSDSSQKLKIYNSYGNVSIGTNVGGIIIGSSITVDMSIIPNGTYNLGSSSDSWDNVYTNSIVSGGDIVLDAAAAFSVYPGNTNVDLGNSSNKWRALYSEQGFFYNGNDGAVYIAQNTASDRPLRVGAYYFRPVGFSYTYNGTNYSITVLATGDPV